MGCQWLSCLGPTCRGWGPSSAVQLIPEWGTRA